MKLLLPKSNASTILHVFILDSTSTAGAGKTGLAYNTASLVAKYIKPGGTLTAMTLEDITTLGTYAAPSSAAHLRFKLIDDTNAPGLYEIHLHADTLATNNSIVIMLFGATGMAPVVLEIQLSSINVNDGVRAGMTGIPNAVPGAENGIFIAGSNAATSITSSSGSALTITSSGGNGCGIIVAGNGSGSGIKSTGGTSGHGIEAILGGGMGTYAIQCNTGSINTASLIGNIVGTISAVASVGAGGIASTSFATGAITAAAIAADAIGASELAADAVAEIADAVWDEASTGHTDAGKAGAQMWTDIDAILVDTDVIGALGAGLTGIPWNAAWDAEVQSECTDALNAFGPPTKTEMDTSFTEIKGATWDSGTDTLEAIRNKEADIETDTQDLQTQVGTAGAGLTAIPDSAAAAAILNMTEEVA